MTGTQTLSETFTLTNARYLASKVAADLFQMQLFYGSPSDQQINEYLEELIALLLNGYLDSVDYGFRRGNDWVVATSYSADFGSSSMTDDRSGGIYPGADITGTYWGSYLRKNSSFNNLPLEEQARIEQALPVRRDAQEEPGFLGGNWITDRNYSNGGTTLSRKMFKPN